MAHPFFDALSFPWQREEARPLLKALTAAISVPAHIDLEYRSSAEDPPPLALLGAPPNVIWKEALENLTTYGGLRTLCERILAAPGINFQIKDVVQQVMNAQSAINVRIISDNMIILDRKRLREQLTLLEPSDTSVSVLLVRGDPQSGKTYSRHLFERLARDQGAQPVYAYAGKLVDVNDAIMQLFSALQALKEIPPRDTSEDAWYRVVCFKLQELAASKKQPLWIAVDDLGLGPDDVPLLDTQIRKFYEQFALNMMDPAFGQWFRLMLIHYPDGPVPTRWKGDFWREDRTAGTDVQQQDIVELVQFWAAAHNRKMVEDEVKKLAGDVVTSAEAPAQPGEQQASRLKRIHNTLTETLKNLAEVSL